MATWTDGQVATKALLDASLPGRLVQSGSVTVTPVANTFTSVHVTFDVAFQGAPRIVARFADVAPGSQAVEVVVANRAADCFDVVVYRTNTTDTVVNWSAWIAPVAFTTGQPAYASLLDQQGGAPSQIQRGQVSITPTTASTPKSKAISFPTAFATPPIVLTTPVDVAPGTVVKGTSATDITTTGCNIWLTRSTLVATPVNWIAIPA